MSRRRSYHTSTAFLDLLFLSLLGFVSLFCLSFILIKTNEQKSTVESKVEFMITMTWPDGNDDDIDLYVEDPNGAMVHWQAREDGLMHLDRDDIGNRNDSIMLPDGTKFEYKENREIVSLRGIIPGEYIVNAHMYTKRSKGPTAVRIKVEKMNPFKIVDVQDFVLDLNGDEKTSCRFTINKEGEVSLVTRLPKKIAGHKNEGSYEDYGEEPGLPDEVPTPATPPALPGEVPDGGTP